ncbi:hypothetical protein [Leptothermofonsia sp. ETS-13]|uniref:hypothetical protein n=1 Tax=Leptothermofonsia sp. ETS-13 TaxID=3035696 RepID=UPI003BA3C440
MGITYADIELINRLDLAGNIQEGEVKHTQVRTLVDGGVSLLAIPESIRDQLDLQTVDEQQAELADESVIIVDLVSPVEIDFMNRKAIAAAQLVTMHIQDL